MPFISAFSTLLCETLGKIQPLSTSRGFLFFRKPVLYPGLKINVDISLCGIVKCDQLTLWFFLIIPHNVISFHDPWDLLDLSGVFFFQSKPEKAHPIGQTVPFETALTIFNPFQKQKRLKTFLGPRSKLNLTFSQEIK